MSRPAGWFEVVTVDGATFSTKMVIAATGSFHAPYRPPIPGLATFAGRLLHSSEYVSPERFAGARIIVVGAGDSAVHIAVELAATAQVTLATRGSIHWVAQRPLGRDVHWWLDQTRIDRAPLGPRLGGLPASVLDHGAYRAAVRQLGLITDRHGRPPRSQDWGTSDSSFNARSPPRHCAVSLPMLATSSTACAPTAAERAATHVVAQMANCGAGTMKGNSS